MSYETEHISARTQRIAQLNDVYRVSIGLFGKVLLTNGIRSLPERDQEDILLEVRTYNDFNEDNDPYHEHDFGAFDHQGLQSSEKQKIFWKIDYYAPDMAHVAEDPANPFETIRVLTVMLASEY